MAKVHPNAPPPPPPPPAIKPLPVNVNDKEDQMMTVWRKSLLFNCRGFTVYDSAGNLTFRVDDYSARGTNSSSSSSKNREMVLMDATGVPLFTIKRKILSLKRDNWVIYQGEETKNSPPLFSVARHVTVRRSKLLAHVIPCRGSSSSSQGYAVEGSYSQRCCTVYDLQLRKAVADICRKECAAPGATLGGDVFRLVVHSGFDGPLAMAIVLILDQMFRA